MSTPRDSGEFVRVVQTNMCLSPPGVLKALCHYRLRKKVSVLISYQLTCLGPWPIGQVRMKKCLPARRSTGTCPGWLDVTFFKPCCKSGSKILRETHWPWGNLNVLIKHEIISQSTSDLWHGRHKACKFSGDHHTCITVHRHAILPSLEFVLSSMTISCHSFGLHGVDTTESLLII